jgi:hypothetical protein
VVWRLLGAIALVLAVSAVPVARAAACDCQQLTPEESASFADVVFTGAAVAEAPAPMPALREGELPQGQAFYTFAVDGVHKGEIAEQTQVLAGGDQGACGMTFAMNERWLIFAAAGEGVLSTHLCAGNVALEPGQEPPLPVTAPTASGSGGSGTGVPVGVLVPVAAIVALAGVSAFLFWRADRA